MNEPTDPLPPPHWTRALVYLFVKPEKFFKTFGVLSIPTLTAFIAWACGVSSIMDRIELRSMLSSRQSPLYEALLSAWPIYWIGSAVLGILSGLGLYWIGGWWYRVRLDWSGAKKPDATLARRVYLYATLVSSLPYLLYTVWTTWHYETPRDAANGDDLGVWFVLAALFWSIYVSYRGVRTTFVVKRWRSRLWFLILPGLIYGVALVGVVMLFLAGMFGAEPDLVFRERLERPGYVLEYPGNWELDSSDEDHDPDYNFSIGPMLADASIRFWFYDENFDSLECVNATMDNLSVSMLVIPDERLSTWGTYGGAGYRGRITIEGDEYSLTAFCASELARPFEILIIADGDSASKTEPGFALIRDSLQLK